MAAPGASQVRICVEQPDPEGGHGYVNVVVLTKAGEVVVADFQNDQHPLFQQRAPKVLQDGEDLAVARLRALLR